MLDKTIIDMRRFAFGFQLFSQIIYIAYLTYAIVCDIGNLIVNTILLGVSAMLFVLFLATLLGCEDRLLDSLKAKSRAYIARAFRITKLSGKIFTLGVLAYSIYTTAGNIDVTAVIMTALMTVSWLLGVVFEIVVYDLNIRKDLFIEAMRRDFAFVSRPVNTVGNVIRKMRGEEIYEPEEPTEKIQTLLDKAVEDRRRRIKEENLTK